MSSISFTGPKSRIIIEEIEGEKRRAMKANAAAVYAAAVFMADRVHETAPEDSGDMKRSIGVSRPRIADKDPESIVEIVAPYTSIVNQRTDFITAVYEREAVQAQTILVDVFEQAMRQGFGPRQINSRYPVKGSYKKTPRPKKPRVDR